MRDILSPISNLILPERIVSQPLLPEALLPESMLTESMPTNSTSSNTTLGQTASYQRAKLYCIAILLIAVVVALAPLLRVPLDSAQTFAFPVLVFLVYQISNLLSVKIPQGLLLLTLVGWIFGALNIRGYINFGASSAVTLLPLEGDSSETQTRELLRRYNIISEAYHLPKMQLLQGSFKELGEARQWLNKHPKTPFVVAGERDWLTIFFPTKISELPLPKTDPTNLTLSEADKYGINLEENTMLIQPAGFPMELVIATAPDSLVIPSEPSELSRHYLAWLASGTSSTLESTSKASSVRDELEVSESPNLDLIQAIARREDALSQTTMMLGAWKSSAPLSLGRFLLANMNLLEVIYTEPPSLPRYATIHSQYYQATKILTDEFDSELESLIRNNIGVARILGAESEEDRKKAEKELLKAASTQNRTRQPTKGARLAMLNLVLLSNSNELAARKSALASEQESLAEKE